MSHTKTISSSPDARASASLPMLMAISGLALSASHLLAQAGADPFPPVLELADLDGRIGFRLDGVSPYDYSGVSVASAGDINGDGIDDLILGAFQADPGYPYRSTAGSSYVIFGRSMASGEAFPGDFELSGLDGTNGFRLDGVNPGDASGVSVSSAGDFNGDGVDDLIVGAFQATPAGRPYAGSTFVVFGRSAAAGATFPASLGLGNLDGTNGFRLDGVDWFERSGVAASAAGDVNGDGIDDLIIGAFLASPEGRYHAGSSYVVFGRNTASGTSFPPRLRLADLDGQIGFRLNGVLEGENTGASVASAGDVNGDGIDDVIIGAPVAGVSYVLFGRNTGAGASFPATLSLADLDGSNGFRLNGGVGGYGGSGTSVASAGDVNGDGIDDLIVGAPYADPQGRARAGSSHVVFGRDTTAGFPAAINLAELDGLNGFRIDGASAGDASGGSVAGVQDLDGDGIDDLVVGALFATPAGRPWAGSSFVVFGRDATAGASFSSILDLADLDGLSGFRLDGVSTNERSGLPVASAGDMNGDGMADLVIGARQASPGGRTFAGSTYVVYGRDLSGSTCRPDLDGDGELTIFDFLAFQNAFDAGDPIADFDGDGSLTIFDFLAFQNAFDAGCP